MSATPDSTLADPQQVIAKLQRQLAKRTAERDEALEQQKASAEILGMISTSVANAKPVFDKILDSCKHLFSGDELDVLLVDDDGLLQIAAYVGKAHEAVAATFPAPVDITPAGRAIRERRVVHYPDVLNDPETPRVLRRMGQIVGYHSLAFAPMVWEGRGIGAIGVARSRGAFTERELELLQSFADQAVIAIGNARLFEAVQAKTSDLEESLEYQTATSDVLQVISRSTFDLQPVLDTLVETAARLCGAHMAHIARPVGAVYRPVATFAFWPEANALVRNLSFTPGRGTLVGRVLLEGQAVQITDTAKDPEYALPQIVRVSGGGTQLGVPLLREGEPIGVILLARQRVEPFTDRQIELVRAFADQAVIAIENTRLLTELRESLEQQQAIAEILQIINLSPGDLAPVFDAMLEKAMRLCEAPVGYMLRYQEGKFGLAAGRGLTPMFAEYMSHMDQPGPREGNTLIREGAPYIHIADMKDDDAYRSGRPLRRATVDLGGGRTGLAMPLRKDGELLGTFSLFRHEVRPFTDKQTGLLQNFAAQAVIAMENARLITETREALEQQTATAEVLQVINSSPGDLTPVFDTMLDKAMRLCGATFGELHVVQGDRLQAAALRGVPAAHAEYRRSHPSPPTPGTVTGRIFAGMDIVAVADMREEDAYRNGEAQRRAVVDLGGARSALGVALRQDKTLLGAILIYRQEVRPFTEKEIAVLQSFAAQAVIAMDNARLLDEIRRRQAELRVTFDNMGDGVAMFDAELRLAAWNRNFQSILDLPDAFIGERPSLEMYVRYLAEHGEYGAVDVEAEVRRLTEAVETQWSAERTRPDGRVIEVRVNPVPGGGLVLIYGDVTERKRAEAEIRTARDAAEKALAELKTMQASLIQAEKMASLGQLTAGIAHEIKNPLNFVNNFSALSIELLEELKESAAPGIATLDEDTRGEIDETIEMLTGNLDKIAEHGKRADNIVKSMLEHSRGVSGERREVDLNALADEALNLAFHGARAQDPSFSITLERDFQPGLAPIEVAPQEMTRVFLNLFSNGFYAANRRTRDSGNGSYHPTLRVTTSETGDVVAITVRDNGTGIPPEIRDRLFQPFFTTKPTGEGTGLGLSISYDIVTQQHGGTITVESEPGACTEFTIRLPRRAEGAVA